jgi:hypothetical protein
MRDQELILRFFALYYNEVSYSKPMKEFLNRFMRKHRKLTENPPAGEFETLFASTVSSIATHVGNDAFRLTTVVNAALCDAIMVGVARRLKQGPVSSPGTFATQYATLLASEQFQTCLIANTTDEATVKGRLALATKAFADVR